VTARARCRSATNGWKLRSAGHSFYRGTTYYTFPAGASVPAGGYLTVFPGTGTTSGVTGNYYLGEKQTHYFPNIDPAVPGAASAALGSTVFLLDPHLDFRGWADYPCYELCAPPAVQISAVQPLTADEYVDLVLNPGETLRIYCNRSGRDTRLVQYWGGRPSGSTMLEDAGDTVILRTAQATTISTRTWGTG
jgi:hypothetical protein